MPFRKKLNEKFEHKIYVLVKTTKLCIRLPFKEYTLYTLFSFSKLIGFLDIYIYHRKWRMVKFFLKTIL